MAVLTNKVQLVTFPHTITASYMAGGAVVLVVGIYRMAAARRRRRRLDVPPDDPGGGRSSPWSPGSASPLPETSRARS
jgi:cytochrome d ubiquinol oxidase subunit I